jgi:hypothetical protein
VITEASKGSKFYHQEEERLSAVREKVDKYMLKIKETKTKPK